MPWAMQSLRLSGVTAGLGFRPLGLPPPIGRYYGCGAVHGVFSLAAMPLSGQDEKSPGFWRQPRHPALARLSSVTVAGEPPLAATFTGTRAEVPDGTGSELWGSQAHNWGRLCPNDLVIAGGNGD